MPFHREPLRLNPDLGDVTSFACGLLLASVISASLFDMYSDSVYREAIQAGAAVRVVDQDSGAVSIEWLRRSPKAEHSSVPLSTMTDEELAEELQGYSTGDPQRNLTIRECDIMNELMERNKDTVH